MARTTAADHYRLVHSYICSLLWISDLPLEFHSDAYVGIGDSLSCGILGMIVPL